MQQVFPTTTALNFKQLQMSSVEEGNLDKARDGLHDPTIHYPSLPQPITPSPALNGLEVSSRRLQTTN